MKSVCHLAWIALVAVGGCRAFGRGDASSKDLVACRELSQQGIRALENGHDVEAQRLLGTAVESCPIDPEARRHYAEALWRQGQQQQALDQITAATRLRADDDALHVRAGEMCLEQNKLDEAAHYASRAIDVNPSSASAWRLRAQVHRRAGRYREALADFHRSLAYEPANRDTLLAIAETYRDLGEPHRALSTLQALSATYPRDEQPMQVLYLEGLSLLAMDRAADAVAVLEQATRLPQATPDLWCALSEAQLRAGRTSDAGAAAESALALDAGHAEGQRMRERVDMARRLMAGGATR